MSDTVVDAGVIEKPAPSRAWRWIILAAIAIACYGGYYAFDYIGPLAPLLNRQLHFSHTDIGLLQAVYSLPNIVAMLVCGVMIDRMGTRKSLVIVGGLIFVVLVITEQGIRLGIRAIGRMLVGSG